MKAGNPLGASTNKTMYNIIGAVVGFLLALFAIWGLVQSQNSSQPQQYQSKISYDG